MFVYFNTCCTHFNGQWYKKKCVNVVSLILIDTNTTSEVAVTFSTFGFSSEQQRGVRV